MSQVTTSALWTATHTALCAKQWPKARVGLDELSRRTDVVDLLPTAKAYGVPDHLQGVIQDRINAVNDRVKR